MVMVCNMFGQCSSRPDPSQKAVTLVTLKRSVGREGSNLRDDAVQIQDALNRVGALNGGPLIPLAVDGFVGPKTIKAISDFQKAQFPEKFPDGRIDPGKRTIGRLNELLVGAPTFNNEVVGSNTANFAPLGNESAFTNVTFPSSTTDGQMALADVHARDAETKITAAVQRMNRAITAMGKKVRTAKEEQLVREINWHFKANADADPATHMAKVSFVLATMLTAIREHNSGTRSIFTKGDTPPSDPNAIAWAYLGGWNSMKQEERKIIITPKFVTQLSMVIVHELAHFCGGSRSTGKDIVHRASPEPFPTGEKREDGSTNYRDMPPFHARTNVYSYLIYCYPDRPEFKVPA
jgi:peptidoglycan hydrolase-like protein with peptidoglycan-binding domain